MTVKELMGILCRLPKGDENAEMRFSEVKRNGVLHQCVGKIERVVDNKGNIVWVSLGHL